MGENVCLCRECLSSRESSRDSSHESSVFHSPTCFEVVDSDDFQSKAWNAIRSWPERLRQCKEANGGRFHYKKKRNN